MQPTANYVTVSRRALELEDYLDIVRRQIHWLLAPMLAGLVVTVVGAYLWPDTYTSVGAIRVVPPQVPERYVPTNVNAHISERVNSMALAILSTSNLTNIIQTYDLYSDKRRRVPMADIVEAMMKDIRIGSVRTVSTGGSADRGASAFQISFEYTNRHVAQKVTRDLIARFIDENMRERSSQSRSTTDFLREQTEKARADLNVVEQKLTALRVSTQGLISAEGSMGLQKATALEAQLSSLNNALSRQNQEKLMLETELRNAQERYAMLTRPVSSAGGAPAVVARQNPELAALNREVEQMERLEAGMLEKYKATHPDVQRLRARLKTVRAERDALLAKLNTAASSAATSAAVPAAVSISPAAAKEILDAEASINRLQASIQAKDFEIAQTTKDIESTNLKLRELNRQFESMPISGQQYSELLRERDTLRARYEDMQRKLMQSEVATEIEDRRQGEMLEVLEPASLPETPTSPNRPMVIGIGAMVGLGIGVMMAAFRELKDKSLKNLRDVRAYAQFTILGCVPLLENDLVVRRRKRIGWLAWTTALLLSVVVVSGSMYYYYSTKL